MTDATVQVIWVAVCTALPPTLMALAAWRQGKNNSVEIAANSRITDNTEKKADTLISKTAEIHTMSNGQLAALQAALALEKTRNEGLERLVVELRTTIAATLTASLLRRRSDDRKKKHTEKKED